MLMMMVWRISVGDWECDCGVCEGVFPEGAADHLDGWHRCVVVALSYIGWSAIGEGKEAVVE